MALRLMIENSAPFHDFEPILEKNVTSNSTSLFIKGPYMMADGVNRNNRLYPLHEMQREIARYKEEMISQGRSLGELSHPNCHTKSASILTESGWKNITEVVDNERVYTLNPETREIELHQISNKIDQAYKGKMYHLKGRNLDTIVTPNHRFLTINRSGKHEFVTAEELYTNPKKYSHSYIPKRGEWLMETSDKFLLKGLKDIKNRNSYNIDPESDSEIDYTTFVQFLGMWLAEGCTSGNIVHIDQKKENVVELIRELLSKFPEEMKWRENKGKNGGITFSISDIRLVTYLRENFGTNCYNKKISKEFKNLSATLSEELVYWFNLGDGRFSTTYHGDTPYEIRNIFSTSKQLILDFNEVLLKSGGAGNIQELVCEADYVFAGRIIKAENKVPLYQLSIATTKGIYLDPRFLKIEEITDFDDRVYCVTVQNSNFYCMDNGKVFWSGNSAEVSLERACHLVTEMWQDGNVFYGKSKVLSTDCGKIVQCLVQDGVKVGMSSRALGQLEESGGRNVVKEMRLVAIDCVADPSFPKAFVNGILESKAWVLGDNGTLQECYEVFEKSISKLPKQDVEAHLRKSIVAFISKLK
jgi:hypothetical protein